MDWIDGGVEPSDYDYIDDEEDTMDNDTTVTATFGKLRYSTNIGLKLKCPECGGRCYWNDQPFFEHDFLLVAPFHCFDCHVSGFVNVMIEPRDFDA